MEGERKSKYELMDEILKALDENAVKFLSIKERDIFTSSGISHLTGLDFSKTLFLLDELVSQRMIEKTFDKEIIDAEVGSVGTGQMLYTISAKGSFFINDEGGFQRIEADRRRQEEEDKYMRDLLRDYQKTSLRKNRNDIVISRIAIGISVVSLIMSVGAILKWWG